MQCSLLFVDDYLFRNVRLLKPEKPNQDNFTDCGVYLLQYVEMIFGNKKVLKLFFVKLLSRSVLCNIFIIFFFVKKQKALEFPRISEILNGRVSVFKKRSHMRI